MTSLIRSSALSGYQDVVRELGADPEPFIRQVQLDADRLGANDYLIPYPALMQLLESTALALDAPDFGLRLSRQQDIETLGPIALIARASNTVQDALQDIARFIGFHSPAIRITVDTQSPGHALLVIDIQVADYPFRRQTLETSMGLAVNVMKLLTQQKFRPAAIHFSHAPGMAPTLYRRYFDCPVSFGQGLNALCLPPAVLELPISTADEFQRQIIARYLSEAGADAPAALSDQVRFIAARLLPIAGCSLGEVAMQLGMHERTLQRRLADEGCVFETLVDDIRRYEAIGYLGEPSMSMARIAGLLGYQEQSSFNRAAKRWFGMTPRAYRQQLIARQRHA